MKKIKEFILENEVEVKNWLIEENINNHVCAGCCRRPNKTKRRRNCYG
jgi:hypothetical protein